MNGFDILHILSILLGMLAVDAFPAQRSIDVISFLDYIDLLHASEVVFVVELLDNIRLVVVLSGQVAKLWVLAA